MTLEIDGFTPIDILGRGGFGVVHRAADDVHGREVAVKVLGRIGDESARRRFDRERRAMGTLSGHPNIGVVYTSGFTANEEPYIVMEMIRGGSLAERLEREGPLPEAEVIELGITLADALQHAHDGGVLHLDLKPENILMSQFGRPKLVDFGIAAMIHEDTSTSTIRATPSFADPQVLEGHPGTVSSDVYGLAATLYTLLSGTPPYSAGPSGLYQMMRRVALDPVPTVERDDVSPELAAVLHRAMAKDPEERPASMREFADELRAVTAAPAAAPTPQWGPGPDSVRDPNRGLPVTPPPGAVLYEDPSGPVDRPTHPTPTTPAGRQSPDPTPVHTPGVAVGGGIVAAPGVAVGYAADPALVDRPVRRSRSALIAALSGVAVLLAIAIVVVVVVRQRDNPASAPTPVLSTPESVPTSEFVSPTVPLVDGEVPSIVGLTTADAQAALEDNGYRPVTRPHCYNRVAGQEPPGGTELDAGEPVELEYEPCIVPDFVGQRLADAISIVEDEVEVGLRISWPDHCDDVVLGQSIEAGTVVEPGTTIELDLPTSC